MGAHRLHRASAALLGPSMLRRRGPPPHLLQAPAQPPASEQDKKRARRLLGGLLVGSLQQAQRRATEEQQSEVAQRRREILKKVDEKAEEDAKKVMRPGVTHGGIFMLHEAVPSVAGPAAVTAPAPQQSRATPHSSPFLARRQPSRTASASGSRARLPAASVRRTSPRRSRSPRRSDS